MLVMTQFHYYVNFRSISQLIKIISRVLLMLLRYFSGSTISKSLVLPSARVFSSIFALKVNTSEFVLGLLGMFL